MLSVRLTAGLGAMTLMQLARIAEGRGAHLLMTFTEDTMPQPEIDDLKMLELAKATIRDAKKCGNTLCLVPVWLMERVVEKAERPHD